MPMSSKFLTESAGKKIVKIGQYLEKIWTKYDSLLFEPPCILPGYWIYTLHIQYTNSCGLYDKKKEPPGKVDLTW